MATKSHSAEAPRSSSHGSEKKFFTLKRIAAGVAGTALLGTIYHQTTQPDHDKHGYDTSNPTAEAPLIPGDTNGDGKVSRDEFKALIANATKAEDVTNAISNIPDSVIIDTYGGLFDKWRQATFDNLTSTDNFSPEAKAVVTVPIGEKENYSDQDVLNANALDEADSATQNNSLEGQVMFRVPYSQKIGGFSESETKIFFNNGNALKVPIFTAAKVAGESLPHPTGEFNGTVLPENKFAQVRIIKEELLPSRDGQTQASTEYGLYGLEKSESEPQWQLIGRWAIDDPGVQDAIRRLIQANEQHS